MDVAWPCAGMRSWMVAVTGPWYQLRKYTERANAMRNAARFEACRAIRLNGTDSRNPTGTMEILPQVNRRAKRSESAAPVAIPERPATTTITARASPAWLELKPL